MVEEPSRGEASTAPVTLEDVQRLLTKQLGDAHMQSRGLGTGVMKDRAFRDAHDEQCRIVSGMAGTVAVVSIEHDLGYVPGYVEFRGARAPVGAPPPHVTIAEVDYDRWTATSVRVEIQCHGAGSLDNVQVKVLIGGRRE